MNNSLAISPAALLDVVGGPRAPRLLDVRRRAAFEASPHMIAGAHWRDPALLDAWAGEIGAGAECVVYCAHGHNVSQMAASGLRARGVHARALAGGIDGWIQIGGVTLLRAALPPGFETGGTRWVTRERPKIDRLACPWLVRRFIDPAAEFHYVETAWVRDVAEEIGGTPFDIEGVDFSHVGERCSFDAFIERFGLADAALDRLATIVRGADTARPGLAPQAAGLLAVSLGLSALNADDLQALEQAMVVYDALYAWCRHASAERHDWQPSHVAGIVA